MVNKKGRIKHWVANEYLYYMKKEKSDYIYILVSNRDNVCVERQKKNITIIDMLKIFIIFH